MKKTKAINQSAAFIPTIWSKILQKKIAVETVMIQKMGRSRFIEAVEEYQNLRPRQWYKKRLLSAVIANTAKYWLDDIKKIESAQSILTIAKPDRKKCK